MQLFSEIFLTPKTWKNRPKKLLIIGPDPFISQSSPDHSPQPTPQNWFFILWNLGTRHLFSYLCRAEQRQSNVRMQQKKFNRANLIMRKVWYHQIWIQTYLGFHCAHPTAGVKVLYFCTTKVGWLTHSKKNICRLWKIFQSCFFLHSLMADSALFCLETQRRVQIWKLLCTLVSSVVEF